MNKDQIRDRVIKILLQACNVQNVDPSVIDPDDYIINKYGPLQLDSLDALEIAVGVERQFGVRFDNVNGAKEALRSINKLVEVIDAHLQAKDQASDTVGTESVAPNPVSYAPSVPQQP